MALSVLPEYALLRQSMDLFEWMDPIGCASYINVQSGTIAVMDSQISWYRSLHCFPFLPGNFVPIMVQCRVPYRSTSLIIILSSSSVHFDTGFRSLRTVHTV
ncbi:unnamed protein product [Albugo candida]|uniref:Uncharacterized protein n=1 Tax=Albugo candida TaxID=65357 RepID=A0A024GEQ7_9STRA|nr:unnamed protein product [Albugo candida]|eukprot:CCI44817.1 unnamed protein product [Albugo candida]